MEDNLSGIPNPSLVYDAYGGIYQAQLVRIALQLDLFTPLSAGPASAAAVARACNCAEIGVRALLDYLCSLKLLDKRGEAYALTPTAAAFFVSTQKTFAGGQVLQETDPERWEKIARAFRTGKPSHHAEDFAQDAWLESFSQSRPSSSLEMWRAAGVEPAARDNLRVLDLACGCAIKSLVLVQANPTIRVTCVDRAEVLSVARDLAERWRVASQATFEPCDILTGDFGDERYDAVLLGQISYYLTSAQNADLFRRVFAALSAGGIFVIDAIMSTDPPTEHASMVTALLWAISGGAAHSFEEYRALLERTGFQRVTQLSVKWLVATK